MNKRQLLRTFMLANKLASVTAHLLSVFVFSNASEYYTVTIEQLWKKFHNA